MKPANTFPQGGWSCCSCHRSFADVFLRWGCPYCRDEAPPIGPAFFASAILTQPGDDLIASVHAARIDPLADIDVLN